MIMQDIAGMSTKDLINGALKTIGASGLMGIAIAAPNMAAALDMYGVFSPQTDPQKRRRCLMELKRQHLVISSQEGSNLRIQLSVKGIHRLQKIQIDELVILPQKKWDKAWRMVMFDIPVRRNESRYILLSQLRRLGFVMIQRSLWLHPYPCFDVIEQIVAYANLQPFVSIAELSRLDEHSTKRLLKHYPRLYS